MSVVSAVITTWSGGGLLRGCLRALAAQSPRPSQCVVVAARPQADLRGVATCWPRPLDLLRLPRAQHHAPAANAGLRRASGEWVLVLNDDTRVQPGFLAALLDAGARHGPGLYQPRILLADGSGRLDNVGHGLFFDGFNLARGRHVSDGARFEGEGTVGAVSGAAFLVHRQVLDALGGFDADFQAFGEDADLSLRAVRLGYPLRYVPAARVEHQLGASYGRFTRRKVYLVERNRVRLALRSLPATALLTMPLWTALRWASLAGRGARRGVFEGHLPAGTSLAALAGVVVGWGHAPQALRKRAADAPAWRRGEGEMWRHLWRERVAFRR